MQVIYKSQYIKHNQFKHERSTKLCSFLGKTARLLDQDNAYMFYTLFGTKHMVKSQKIKL